MRRWATAGVVVVLVGFAMLAAPTAGQAASTQTGTIESRNMSESLSADTIRITGHGGEEIEAYAAHPALYSVAAE